VRADGKSPAFVARRAATSHSLQSIESRSIALSIHFRDAFRFPRRSSTRANWR
jgi:hypothetical protein